MQKTSIDHVCSAIAQMTTENKEAKSKIYSTVSRLDFEVASKKNIETRLKKLEVDINRQEILSEGFRNNFRRVTDSLIQSDAKYGDRTRRIVSQIKSGVDNRVYSVEKMILAAKLCKFSGAAGMFLGGESVARVSLLDRLKNKIKKITKTVKSNIKKVYGNVVQAGTDTISWAKKTWEQAKESYDNKGAVYKAVEYGKAALKVGKSVVKIAGAVAAIATGAGIPIAILSIVSAGNDFVNGMTDVAMIHEGLYDQVGQTNVLKDYLVDGGKEIGKIIGNEAIGETIGNAIYTGIDIVTFLDGADKMLTSMGKVNTVVTGEYGSSGSFFWDPDKVSFEAIANSKIKFDLEPDYFIRKILKIDPASDCNIVYEAGKNIYKMFSKAAKVGKEIGGLI